MSLDGVEIVVGAAVGLVSAGAGALGGITVEAMRAKRTEASVSRERQIEAVYGLQDAVAAVTAEEYPPDSLILEVVKFGVRIRDADLRGKAVDHASLMDAVRVAIRDEDPAAEVRSARDAAEISYADIMLRSSVVLHELDAQGPHRSA